MRLRPMTIRPPTSSPRGARRRSVRPRHRGQGWRALDQRHGQAHGRQVCQDVPPPRDADATWASAVHVDGLLTISVPKREAAKETKVLAVRTEVKDSDMKDAGWRLA